jgi:hypothetical protein
MLNDTLAILAGTATAASDEHASPNFHVERLEK